jgi:two-component system, cell cycle sensor histidine kinase and response regulator CckA
LINRETILLVEDDIMSLDNTAEYLRSHGLNVRTADDGEEALAIFLGHPAEIVLVLSDLNLPGCTGDQLCRRLHALAPRLPVIIISGYASPEQLADLHGAGVDAVVLKPYRLPNLLARIRETLRIQASLSQ